jgi:hypothetical protein
MPDELFESMKQSIFEGDPDRARAFGQRALAEGVNPLEAINGPLFRDCARSANSSSRARCFVQTWSSRAKR